jgi:hypothetical protein
MTTTTDPITVLRVRLADDRRRLWSYYLCPRSLAARLAADAAESGDTVEDLGSGALPMITQAANRKRAEYGKGTMVLVGTVKGSSSKWLRWYPPAPVEAVPGSAGQAGARN